MIRGGGGAAALVTVVRAPDGPFALGVTIWITGGVGFCGLVTELVTGGLRRRDGKAGGL